MTVMVALAAGACGGDDDTDDASSGEDPSGSASAPADGGGGGDDTDDTLDFGDDDDHRGGAAEGEHPCDVVDGAALDALAGTSLGEGEAATVGVNENDVQWSATGCKWKVEDQIEAEVHLVRAADYTAGEVVCPELSDMVATVTAVPGLGDSAQWRYQDSGSEGELRACTATGMVTAKIELEDPAAYDEATLRSLATALVEPTLALV
jgi:hypothetical protein